MSEEARKWAKEHALEPGGWVENRFRVVEDRIASLEGDEADPRELDLMAEAICGEGMTVGRLRAMLGRMDPRTPLGFEDDKGRRTNEAELWTSYETDGTESTPLRQVQRISAVVRLGTFETHSTQKGHDVG